MAIINASAGDFITFSENEAQVSNPSHVVELLSFTESATTANRQGSVTESILISESPHNPFLPIAVASDSVLFFDSAARGAHASAFDGIGFVDFAGLFHGGNQADTLNILDTVSAEVCKAGRDTLSLVESATSRLNANASSSDILSLNEAALGFRVTCIPIDHQLRITLYSGTTTLVLVAPAFGDTRRRDIQRVNRRSRGNDLIIYRDPSWVRSDHVTYRLDNLNEGQKYNLLNFLEFTTGQIVQMRDHENNLWQGFILNPNTAMTQTGVCSYSCELQFSGAVIQNGYV